jgi:hypothetical protein
MADVFISYAHQDGELVKELSPALEAAGYTTWYYEDRGAIGASYLRQIDQEIERCHAVIVVISPDSVDSDQVSKEIIRAHEARKKFVPVRRDISHAEFQKRQPEWRMAFGAAVSAEVPEEGAAALGPRLVAGLKALGVEPGGPPALPSSPLRRLSRAAARGGVVDTGLGSIVAAIVGGLGLPLTLFNLSRALSPTEGTPEGFLMAAFPGFRTATILANLAGVAQNALLLYGARLLRKKDPRGAPLLRKVALSILAAVGLWLLVSLSSFSGDAIPDAAARGRLIGATIGAGMVGLIPAGIVFALFRNARKGRSKSKT